MKLFSKRPAANHTNKLNKLVVVMAGAVVGTMGEALRRTRQRAAIQRRQDSPKAAMESNETFHQLADNLSDAFWIRSADMREVHYVSPAFETIWGRSVDSLYAFPDNWITYVLPEDRMGVLAAFKTLADGAASIEVEYRIIRPGGEIRWVCVRGFPVRDSNGKVIRHTGMVTDTTERKRVDEALRASERQHRQVAEQLEIQRSRLEAAQKVAKIGSWEIPIATLDVVWSSETYRIFETDPLMFAPTRAGFLEFVHPDDREMIYEAFFASMEKRTASSLEHRLLLGDGRIKFVEERWEVFFDESDVPVRAFGTCQDITERKIAEMEISRANRALKLMSACNEALVRVDSELDLLERVCGVAIEIGGYRTAWVDYVEDGLDQDVRPTGESGDLRFPLRDADQFLGCLNLRPSNGAAPTGEERKLLQEMADNLAFGMANRRAEAEKRRKEAAMITVAASVSAATSNVFFEQLAFSMAEALGAKGAFVAEFLPGEPIMARSIAAVVDGALVPNFDYAIAGTPCEGLLTADTCVLAEQVIEQFPHFDRLMALDAQACVGRRLDNSSGDPLGLLFVAFGEPLKHVEFITSTLQIFAARAASEMERQQTDAQVREQAALLDIAHEAIIVKDMDNRIIYWNRGAERTYGWTAEEALGKDSLDLLYTNPDSVLRARTELLESGKWEGELTSRVKSGSIITIHARWTLVRDTLGKPKSIFAIKTDITEMKKLESKFLRAQRMEGIGTLASGMAHDLNNVLAPILLATEMLKSAVTDPDDVILLTTLTTSARRGAELVKQVLSFARGLEGDRAIVSPLDLMRDFLDVIRDTFPKSIDIQFTSPGDLWTVLGDATQMNQVFLNLCVNSRDAMPDGGRLTIALSNVVLDDAFVSMNPDYRPGAYVVMTFEDTGAGIPLEIRDRIFEPFFTTKEIGKGTGLGLSTTLGIVKSHGGFVDLNSEVDRGTTFKVYLAANSVQTVMKSARPDESNRPRGNGELILVVDDEAAIRNVTKRILESFGYRVILASDGAEAVELYARKGSQIAVVLTDMSMPVMDGATAIMALQEINPAVRIIGSSGLAFSGGGQDAGLVGLRHFITKPYTAEVMLRTLKEVLE